MRLEGKVALITGGGGGIGRSTALRMAAEGAKVAINDVNAESAQAVADEVSAAGGEAMVVEADVTNMGDVQNMVSQIVSQFGSLDIAVNNAGITRDGLSVRVKDGEVKMMSEDKWDAVINVNLKGTFLVSQAAGAQMIQQGNGGRIINTSSIGALGNIGQANYAASKAGVVGLTKTMALELARYGISVNCVSPGATKTPMTETIPEKVMEGLLRMIPFRRMGEPEEIAALHTFLASDDASYITGQVIFADGGISVGV
jgi:3-oxoacyl-[acyl-carrier protein] reductase